MKYFKTQDTTTFTYSYYRYGSFGLALIFGFIIISPWVGDITKDNIWGKLISAVIIGYSLYQANTRVSINKNTSQITHSHWGLFKSEYDGKLLEDFSTVQHLYFGLVPDGTDIKAVFANQNKEITLLERVRKNKVSPIIAEIESLIGKSKI